MEDYVRKEKPEEVIISFQKIWDNFKKYWWICLLTTLLAAGAAAAITLKEYKEAAAGKPAGVVYRAATMVYMDPSQLYIDYSVFDSSAVTEENLTGKKDEALNQIAKGYHENVDLNREGLKNSINQWNWTRHERLLYDSMVLLSSKRITSRIDAALEEAGMEPFSAEQDTMEMKIEQNSRCYRIFVYTQEEKRAVIIANTATSALMKDAEEIFQISGGRIIDHAVVEKCRATGNEEEPYEAISGEEGGIPVRLTLESFFSLKKLAFIVIGLFVGLGILFIFILKDKKVRDKEEMELYFGIPYLGSVEKRKKKEYKPSFEVLAETLFQKCRKEEIREFLLTAPSIRPGNDVLLQKLKDYIEKKDEDLKILLADNFLENPEAVKNSADADGIVIIIRGNADELPQIEKMIEGIKAVKGRILGYVLCE